MNDQSNDEKNGCILTWKIENFLSIFFGYHYFLETPECQVLVNGKNTKWKLHMYLCRSTESINHNIENIDGEESLESKLVLEFFNITSDGKSELVHRNVNFSCEKNRKYAITNCKVEEMLKNKSFYFPADSFTVQCRIRTATQSSQPFVEYFALTKVNVTKLSFQKFILISEVLSPDYETKITPLPKYALEINLSKETNSNAVSMEFRCTETIYLKCKLSVMDSEGTLLDEMAESNIFSNFNDSTSQVWNFPKSIQLKDLKEKMDDIFSLRFDIIMRTGNSNITRKGYVESLDESQKKDGLMAALDPLSRELETLYIDKKYADVQLKLGDKTLQSHKNILCSRSPVFAAMFDNNMAEKMSSVVEIEDVDADTFDELLFFMYTGRQRNVSDDMAIKLLTAADKYQVISLKEICAAFLKSLISVQNACRILHHADTHDEKSLKSYAQEYICDHHRDILTSDEWKQFTRHAGELASEIFHKLSLKYLNL